VKCETHNWKEATGYCKGCGVFGCSDCLQQLKNNSYYCRKCAQRLGLKTSRDSVRTREDHITQKLVVHLRNGKLLKGTTYKLNTLFEGFYLVPIGRKGKGQQIFIKFADIKAVFLVKDFHKAPKVRAPRRDLRSGYEITVCFFDGEVLEGFTPSNYNNALPRFYVSPHNPEDNAYDILVERSATVKVEIGKRAAPPAYSRNDLISSPIKRKILDFYWKDPKRTISLRALSNYIGAEPSKIESELAPFVHFNLISIVRQGDASDVIMSPPEGRSLRDFIIKGLQLIQRTSP